jgi:hypothetical protein
LFLQAIGIYPLLHNGRRLESDYTARRIGAAIPVFGFRPMRFAFLRTVKVPNDDNFTASPLVKLSVISVNTNSTREADSERDSPARQFSKQECVAGAESIEPRYGDFELD